LDVAKAVIKEKDLGSFNTNLLENKFIRLFRIEMEGGLTYGRRGWW
jgi:hypothetical protein